MLLWIPWEGTGLSVLFFQCTVIARIQKFKVDVGIRLTAQYKEGRTEKTMVKFHVEITRLISVCLRHSD